MKRVDGTCLQEGRPSPSDFVVKAFAIVGGACWFVLTGRWTLIRTELEKRIRSQLNSNPQASSSLSLG